MEKRILTDTERLDVALDLLDDRSVELYLGRCKQLEDTEPSQVEP